MTVVGVRGSTIALAVFFACVLTLYLLVRPPQASDVRHDLEHRRGDDHDHQHQAPVDRPVDDQRHPAHHHRRDDELTESDVPARAPGDDGIDVGSAVRTVVATRAVVAAPSCRPALIPHLIRATWPRRSPGGC